MEHKTEQNNAKSKKCFFCSIVIPILLTLILLEVTTRIWLTYLTDEQSFLKYASFRQLQKLPGFTARKWTLHRYLGYYPTPNYKQGLNRHNSLGFRGDEIEIPKPVGVFRIVCLGGSTTYTTEIEDYKMSYPSLLQEELRQRGYAKVEVVNSGVGAWTTSESLINLELRVLDLDPDMIIVYHGVNDLLMRFVWPPEAYKGDYSGARNAPGMFMPSILEYSTLARYIMIRMGIVLPYSYFERHLSRAPMTAYSTEFHKQKHDGIYPEGIFKKVSAQKMLSTNNPRYFKRNMESMVAIAKSRGIKTILATFAHSNIVGNEPFVSSVECRVALAEMNDVVKSVAEVTGAHLFDFASLFPDGEKYYYADGIHMTIEGAKQKTGLFANYIVENNLLSKSE